MKKTQRLAALFTALLLVVGIGMVSAQPPQMKGKGPSAEEMTRNLQQELGLSTEQYAKVLAINTDFETQLKAMRKENKGNRDGKREKRKELMSARNQQIKAVLTDEQVAKFDALEAQRPKHGKAKGKDKPRD